MAAPRSPADVSPARRALLNAGEAESANLAESLAVDMAALLQAAAPFLREQAIPVREEDLLVMAQQMRNNAGLGVTRRMALAAQLLLEAGGEAIIPALMIHPSDTVRGWSAYAVGLVTGWSLAARLVAARPLADDAHFGVREWAWLGVRAHIVAAPQEAIELLAPWTVSDSAGVRRFASEATRPRGVWAPHIPLLKREPWRGLPVLAPLAADPSKYVRDSVANWVNDAGKDHPDWARALCDEWLSTGQAPTQALCRRALRNL